jgi:hypothetical protein
VAPGFRFPAAFAAAAAAAGDPDGSPGAASARRAISLPKDCLFRWFVQACGGAQSDFLFIRQAFAGGFAAFAFFMVALQVAVSPLPSVLLFDDRRRVAMPGFLTTRREATDIPLTAQFAGLLPPFVLRGAAAATWHVLADTIAGHADEITIVLEAVMEQDAGDFAEKMVEAATKMATIAVGEEETAPEAFPFVLFEHLVDASGDAWRGRTSGFAWI